MRGPGWQVKRVRVGSAGGRGGLTPIPMRAPPPPQDTVNVASRMESTGVAGATQVTPEIYELLQGDAVWQPQGYVNVKGKGRIQTWITVWNQPDNDTVCELGMMA